MPTHEWARLFNNTLDQDLLASCKAWPWKDVFTTLLSVCSQTSQL